jgi:uncharacterized protein YbjQ (UPF0145 family)
MTTTAFTLDGFRVVENLGVVRGITVDFTMQST